jgi:alpha-1,3-rhamnosyl/mannosyltransferase
MRVVLNQLAALGRKTGIGHYTDQLLRGLVRQAGPDRIEGFPTGWVRQARELAARARPYLEGGGPTRLPGGQPPRPHNPGRLRSTVLQHLRQCVQTVVARHFRTVCARANYDLYHEPNFIPLPCDRPTVATFHDLSVLLHPEWHPADRVAYYERNFRRTLGQCVHYLTVSEFTRQEVIHTLGIAPDQVTRVYNGIRPELGPQPREEVVKALHRLALPPRYLLYVGTIEPRKNVLLLLRAYCALPGPLRERWPLLLVGSWGWNAGAVAEYLGGVARHRGVLHVGYLGDQDLVTVYNGARALVYPSLYEGFGLPPVEMLACGGAVLASTAGALVETVGEQAHLVEPEDFDGWYKALLRVLKDDDWWHALRDGARAAAQPFSWDRCAADTLRVYRSLCGRRPALRQPVPEVSLTRRAAG